VGIGCRSINYIVASPQAHRKRGRLAARGGVNNSRECGYVQIGPDPVSKNHTL
jgi:hypothetical protein